MKDRFFTIIIIILLGIYGLNRFGDADKFEATVKNSDVYKIYQQFFDDTPESTSPDTARVKLRAARAEEVVSEPQASESKPSSIKYSPPKHTPSQYSSTPTKVIGDLTVAHFQEAIPKPSWYDSVEAPIATTSAEVSKVWQSKKRCCESKEVLKANNQEFYKTCYRAIENYFSDEELVVKCLWLMDTGATREHSLKIKRFLVANFSHHKNNITRCANCAPADTVARVTLELSSRLRRDGNPDESIALVERVLDTRLPEISPWVQTEIYTKLSRWYAEDHWKRRNRVAYALQNLGSIGKSGNKSVERRFPRFQKNAEKFLKN